MSEFDHQSTDATHGKAYRHARRAEAVTLAMAGLTYEQIGDKLGISTSAAWSLVNRTINETRNYAVDQLRLLENARLDRAQAAIWNDVLEGNLKAIDAYLKISDRRSKLNGLDAPTKVQMSVSVRQEMEEKLSELQKVIEGEVVDHADVVAEEEAAALEPYADYQAPPDFADSAIDLTDPPSSEPPTTTPAEEHDDDER